MTQEEVGESMGVAKSMVSKLETGGNMARLDKILSYAAAIGVEPEALFRHPTEPSIDDLVRAIPEELRGNVLSLVAALSIKPPA